MSSPDPHAEPLCERCEKCEEMCKCFREIRDEQGYVVEVEEVKVDTRSGDEHMQDE